MKIVIAPDKFKGSMSSVEVADTIAASILIRQPEAQIVKVAMADGGEGSVEVLTSGRGSFVTIDCVDPLMRPIRSTYGIVDDSAIIDMSQEVGLTLLTESERNPERTTSYGFGVAIADALRRGVKRLVLCIGGSATNDCGIGMLSALGFSFRDACGVEIDPVGANLIHIERITPVTIDVPIVVACDVTNPLYGEHGAAYIYAPQKGADSAMCERLDAGLRHFSDVVRCELGVDLSVVEGGGAAGGVGAALIGLLGAEMVRGAEFIAKELNLFEHIRTADLVITGEGRVDASTLHDKLVSTIAHGAARYGIPVVVVCGVVEGVTAEELGVRKIVAIKKDDMTTDESIRRGKELLLDVIF